ncbi:TerB family tellurite resistance protein, partial [Candidatus Pelagibacter sp.]|nr:TerB family tellurite resistance protein [Candidatus Pelagibacter sp.]
MTFFSKDKFTNNNFYIKVASLLIHSAKIDEFYTEEEDKIIRKTIIELGATNFDIDEIMSKASTSEAEASQILDFTREVKNTSELNKIKIIETLWKIIYSDKNADIYESNLMRRLAGLLYIDNKV